MQEFLLGVLTCWTILGLIALIGNTLDWQYDDRFWMFLSFPILVIAAPFYLLWYIVLFGLLRPWRWVIKPVSKARWDEVGIGVGEDKTKVYRISERFYFCIDPKPVKWYNRRYFVRIRKEN